MRPDSPNQLNRNRVSEELGAENVGASTNEELLGEAELVRRLERLSDNQRDALGASGLPRGTMLRMRRDAAEALEFKKVLEGVPEIEECRDRAYLQWSRRFTQAVFEYESPEVVLIADLKSLNGFQQERLFRELYKATSPMVRKLSQEAPKLNKGNQAAMNLARQLRQLGKCISKHSADPAFQYGNSLNLDLRKSASLCALAMRWHAESLDYWARTRKPFGTKRESVLQYVSLIYAVTYLRLFVGNNQTAYGRLQELLDLAKSAHHNLSHEPIGSAQRSAEALEKACKSFAKRQPGLAAIAKRAARAHVAKAIASSD